MNQISIYESKYNVIPLFDNSKIDLLKNTICKGSTDEEFELFLHACKRTGLDPFMKQIHAVPRWDPKLNRNAITIQTGIDGYRLIAERTGKYSPGKEPTYKYDDNGNIISCTAYIKKQTNDGTWHEVAATAFFSEYCQKTKDGRPTKFWIQLGHVMIAKCAEALALRKAFPGDLSGIYTKEEMSQADAIDSPIECNVNHISDVKKMVQIPMKDNVHHIEQNLELILNTTEDEWKTLKILISQCSEKFQENVWNKLKEDDVNDENFFNMHRELYNKISLACQGHLSKSKKVKNETSSS